MTPSTLMNSSPTDPATTFATYAAARQYLEPFAQHSGLATTPHFALQRAKALMALLGNPQDAVPTIHLAGTSGKGSTATILAALLHEHGLTVGMGLSPHVRHLLERIQINGAPVNEREFCRGLGEMVPAIAHMQRGEWGAPSFFEILIALTYKLFAEAPVDVIVMETGLGGRYDATNTITRADKIALFTDINYDHVEILGTTLTHIAGQKAGIIQPHNRVLTYLQPEEAQVVIAAESAAQQAPLTVFDPAGSLYNIELYDDSVVFALKLPEEQPLVDLHLALAGAHQASNAGLAIAAAQLFLRDTGRTLDPEAIRRALAHVELPGRMDHRVWRGVRYIIDGAHNAQKIHALCTALAALYPKQRFVFVVALKQGKDHAAIFAQLLPLAAHIILTRFDNDDQGMPVIATEPETLAALLPQETDVPVTVDQDVARALALAADVAKSATGPVDAVPVDSVPVDSVPVDSVPVVVTGSLYLLAQVYDLLDGENPDRNG